MMMVPKPEGLCRKEWWCVLPDGHEPPCATWETRESFRKHKQGVMQ